MKKFRCSTNENAFFDLDGVNNNQSEYTQESTWDFDSAQDLMDSDDECYINTQDAEWSWECDDDRCDKSFVDVESIDKEYSEETESVKEYSRCSDDCEEYDNEVQFTCRPQSVSSKSNTCSSPNRRVTRVASKKGCATQCSRNQECKKPCECHCSCNEEHEEVCVIRPKIVAKKSVSRKIAIPGECIKYSITINNEGTVPVIDVVLKDKLDENVEVIKESIEVDGKKVCNGNIEKLCLGTLEPCENVTVTFKVIIKDMCSKFVTNSCIVKYSYMNKACNQKLCEEICSNTVTTKVVVPNTVMQKKVDKTEVNIGDELMYAIDIKNKSELHVDSFILKDCLDKDLQCLEVSVGQKQYCCSDLEKGIELGAIDSNGNMRVIIKVKVTGLGDCGVITNKAEGIVRYNCQTSIDICSNEVCTKVNFNQSREFDVSDEIKLTCEQGPAIGIIDVKAKAKILKVEDLGCHRDVRKLKVYAMVTSKYLYDKGYGCQECVKKELPICLTVKIPASSQCIEKLEMDLKVTKACAKINCGYTIESSMSLKLNLKSKTVCKDSCETKNECKCYDLDSDSDC